MADLPPVILWGHMLERIYSGNAPDAIFLFDSSWPPDLPGKSAFWSDFVHQLRDGWAWNEFGLRDKLNAGDLFVHRPI